MLHEQLKKLKTEPRDLRKFGLLVGGVLLLLGGWFFYRHKAHYPYFLGIGVVLLTLGLVAPRSLKQVYVGWMGVGFLLGLIVSTTLLTMFFYLVVTPIGLIARLMGKDFLARKWDQKANTYWLARDRTKAKQPVEYERQF
jgi:polyferredoxin